MAGEGEDTDDSDDPSTPSDDESQVSGSGALVVRMVVLEGMRRMRLVVVVMARLVVMVVRMLRVVVTEWFCRFLFVLFFVCIDTPVPLYWDCASCALRMRPSCSSSLSLLLCALIELLDQIFYILEI